MNTFASTSAMEQMNPSGKSHSNEPEYQSTFEEVSFTKPYQGLCNTSSQMSPAKSCRGKAFQTSKGSKL
ncbi:hypothetical protein PanWU01x14_241480 [Parasponia andersonii]|nr:hypothetical protein PanWU01x14_241480 [Parasponia andersonii]